MKTKTKIFTIQPFGQRLKVTVSDTFKGTMFEKTASPEDLALTDLNEKAEIVCVFLRHSFDINTLVHETVHIKNLIVKHYCAGVIDDESEAYLSGYIADKLFSLVDIKCE